MLRSTLSTQVVFLVAAVAALTGTASATTKKSAQSEQLRVPLTRIYRGDDGGAVYLRQLGNKVYGFGEHPGPSSPYAYVLTGNVSGDRIAGSWWDVPKGELRRVNKGTLDLQWSQGGARIVRKGGADPGPDVLTAIEPSGIAWPNLRAAGFQSTTTGDLSGVFVGDDGSRHYVRETSANTVWVAERAAQPEERPGWVTVFAGKRKSGGGISGTFVDVPKGLERDSGNFGAALVGSKRELVLNQVGAERSRKLSPDYALDWDAFVDEIAAKLDDHVVGYAFALAHNGAIGRSHAWGFRRLAVDGGNLAFTPKTQAQTASSVKTVTAAAMIKALNDRGLTVDSKVAPFLPSCIEKGPGMSTLTFRQLLNHTSGLPGGKNSGTQSSCNGRDPYECLLEILAKGRTQSRNNDYNNKAYDLLRLLVPLVSDTTETKAEFEHFDCKNKAGVLHRKVAERFARYVRYEVLKPVGSDASWYPSGDFSLNYNCNAGIQGGRCYPNRKGEAMTPEYFLRSASGKTAMSALDYVRFLSALDRGLIIPKTLVESMKGTPGNRLGFDTAITGAAGEYHWKNGGCPSLDHVSWGRGCSTLAMVFPGGVQAYVAINSKNNTYSPGLTTILRDAFDAALK